MLFYFVVILGQPSYARKFNVLTYDIGLKISHLNNETTTYSGKYIVAQQKKNNSYKNILTIFFHLK